MNEYSFSVTCDESYRSSQEKKLVVLYCCRNWSRGDLPHKLLEGSIVRKVEMGPSKNELDDGGVVL